jgi:serine/threonine protein kinase
MQQKGEKHRDSKMAIPKGRVLYEVGGTPFVVDEKYEIIKQIGSGAYGVVASALDREKNKKVAIKKVRKLGNPGHQRLRRPHRRQTYRPGDQIAE